MGLGNLIKADLNKRDLTKKDSDSSDASGDNYSTDASPNLYHVNTENGARKGKPDIIVAANNKKQAVKRAGERNDIGVKQANAVVNKVGKTEVQNEP